MEINKAEVLEFINKCVIREYTTFYHLALVYSVEKKKVYKYTRFYKFDSNNKLIYSDVTSSKVRRLAGNIVTKGDFVVEVLNNPSFKDDAEEAISAKLNITGLPIIEYIRRLNEIEYFITIRYSKQPFELIDARRSLTLLEALDMFRYKYHEDILSFLNRHPMVNGGYSLYEKTKVPAVIFYDPENSRADIIFNGGTVTYQEDKVRGWFTVQSNEELSGDVLMKWLPRFSEDVFLILSYLASNMKL